MEIDINPVPRLNPVCDSLLNESMADLVGIERPELASIDALKHLSPMAFPFPEVPQVKFEIIRRIAELEPHSDCFIAAARRRAAQTMPSCLASSLHKIGPPQKGGEQPFDGNSFRIETVAEVAGWHVQNRGEFVYERCIISPNVKFRLE